MATTVNQTIYEGDDITFQFTVQDTDAVAVDLTGLTGAEIHYVVQPAVDDYSWQVYKEIGSGVTLVTPVSGILDVDLLQADTSTLDVVANGTGDPPTLAYFHQVRIEKGSEKQVVVEGTLTIKPAMIKRISIVLDQPTEAIKCGVTTPVGTLVTS